MWQVWASFLSSKEGPHEMKKIIMMSCTFLVVGAAINGLSQSLESNFLCKFLEQNLILLLVAILTINTTFDYLMGFGYDAFTLKKKKFERVSRSRLLEPGFNENMIFMMNDH
jgi:hypothetical protein